MRYTRTETTAPTSVATSPLQAAPVNLKPYIKPDTDSYTLRLDDYTLVTHTETTDQASPVNLTPTPLWLNSTMPANHQTNERTDKFQLFKQGSVCNKKRP